MPPRPAIANTAEFQLIYSRNGAVCENVIHISYDDDVNPGWDAAALTNRCDDIKFEWWDTWKTEFAASVALTHIKGQDIGVAGGGAEVDYATDLPSSGTEAGGALPNNVTKAVKLSTGVAGRSHRGRIYHVGLTDNFLDDSNQDLISADGQTAIRNVYSGLVDILNQGVGDDARHMSIVSWKLADHFKVTQVSLSSPYVDTMRRRLR